jgi:hypothetical protein
VVFTEYAVGEVRACAHERDNDSDEHLADGCTPHLGPQALYVVEGEDGNATVNVHGIG